jgi:predicted site-specific integrase-resolvase
MYGHMHVWEVKETLDVDIETVRAWLDDGTLPYATDTEGRKWVPAEAVTRVRLAGPGVE